ncbi:AP-3 complex subunit sigma-2, partial [Termitomyces sp. T32_za158]
MEAELRSTLERDDEDDDEEPPDYNLIKNFLESFKSQGGLSGPVGNLAGNKDEVGGRWQVVYRNYATLFFVFVVDGAESELGILDLIQVFVECLDRAFENVCELDLVFHFDE